MMYFINCCFGFYSEDNEGFRSWSKNVRFAKPFETWEQADSFAKEFTAGFIAAPAYYAILKG